ncbi:MAG: GAF domain-containing sensor histidine kinase, partial [Chloroflexales bacterium]|nr:GAF domain-containing sensor histidine kinase [Chloroflexales bacterium]
LVLRAIRSNYLQPRAHPIRLTLERVPPLSQAMDSGRVHVLATPGDDSSMMEYLSELFGNRLRGRTWLAAPLLAQGQVIGLLLLANDASASYGDPEIRQLESFTSPIAIALQNASLRQAAQHAAVLEERTRLARELHDAVTQTLFSANLIAEALPDVLRQSPVRASRGVMELRRLTAGALAEMRTLLLELRPKALTERPLGQLLQVLCTSVSSRTAIPIHLTVARNCTLDAPVQLVFYRVAQEALNNVVKHAEAQQVVLYFDCTAGEATLRVSDDGQGFDHDSVRPDSLGLGIMRERAAEIGATLTITSAQGEGATLTLNWQAPA